MKPYFERLPTPAAQGGIATDLHDSVAKLPDHVQTGDDSLTVLLPAGQRIELKTGEWLFRRGDTGRRLFVVQSGSLDVVVQGVDGHEQTLRRFGPGGVFGEVSFPLGGGRSASVRAHERCVVVGIDWIEDDATANGRLGLALAAVLAQRLRSNNALLLDLLSDDDGGAAPSAQAGVGYSYFETRGDAERLDHYFDQAVPTIAEIRQVCAPLLIPIDRLRLELDEHWPGGAGLASLGGRKMFVGTSRLFEDGHSLPPHQDILARETDDEVATRLLTQMTVNVYLRTPRSGGELEIWDLIPNEQQVAELYTGDYDFLDSSKLPPSAVLIKPGVGDLILMLSSRVHSVRASSGGPRVSMSCFVGTTGESERLVLWN